ncbi:MAG: hypothetical protein HQL27_06390, partial [Candidatus Omnitrophica bacterium]|nr:hypothetical protein [Candidatus Omnitrophota bacterium]
MRKHLISIAFVTLLLFGFSHQTIFAIERNVTVGIIGFIPREEATSFENRILWLKNQVSNILQNQNLQADIIFGPEYLLSFDYDYLMDTWDSYVCIIDSNGIYNVISNGSANSDRVVEYIEWLKSMAQTHKVSFFVDVWEYIDLARYGEVGTAWDTTGIIIDSTGIISGITRKMIDFGARWEGCPPELCNPEDE